MSNPSDKIEKGTGSLEGFDLAARAARIIKNLVADEIFVLSKISDSICDFMNRDQKIKNAAVPDVSAMSHHPPFTYQSRTWNDFRDERNAGMNSQVEVFAIANVDADGLHQIGCFKIIQDDCNDMVDALENAETLVSPLVESILLSISDVVGRYHYMCAYHGMKYRENRQNDALIKGRNKGQETIAEKRSIKAKHVIDCFTRMINNPRDRASIENVSEYKMAAMIKARIEPDLRTVKTSKGIAVLKKAVVRNDVIWKGLETETIINILRNDRDKTKLPWYPWENISKT